jgi:hypothetical protein
MTQAEFLAAVRGTILLDVLDAFEDDDDAPTHIQSLCRENAQGGTPASVESHA